MGLLAGLDPAEPHFSKTDPIMRLDPTDAHFVDVIHTDARPFISGGLGILQPVGHVDFYPNGGEQMPGCDGGVMFYMNGPTGSFVKGMYLTVLSQGLCIQHTLFLKIFRALLSSTILAT